MTADSSAPEPLLVTVEDAARRLGIARTSMFRLIQEQEVDSVRIGRLRRVPVVCLDEYVARLRSQDAPGEKPPLP
ncbi:hypothetical protein ASD11_17275 [Aeromicrobium sp. Root495]|uniref:helix-turn-helix domain-containing protein n=1 Tax=Aeromicrobium sp. Root495 TaxID=1736550 RepID=UPI0006F3E1B0|nr:helix-turn-helix domain-containing protein [Aeromicrobium sp. Root495]KQY55303.1 hypothetical protein ASD11_17275 [Aeromicrobium sp. Root495]